MHLRSIDSETVVEPLRVKTYFPCIASLEPSLEMENEEKIRRDARRRLEEQLKQYRVQRHKERVSARV